MCLTYLYDIEIIACSIGVAYKVPHTNTKTPFWQTNSCYRESKAKIEKNEIKIPQNMAVWKSNITPTIDKSTTKPDLTLFWARKQMNRLDHSSSLLIGCRNLAKRVLSSFEHVKQKIFLIYSIIEIRCA